MKYKEILRLKEMLEQANIPFEFTDDFFKTKESKVKWEDKYYPAYQIRLNKSIDVIEHWGSYGEAQDKLEIMGALTAEEYEDDSVLGYLSAEEVFKRFKYCYENNTSVYKENKQ